MATHFPTPVRGLREKRKRASGEVSFGEVFDVDKNASWSHIVDCLGEIGVSKMHLLI